jgi:hypothetical protein
MFLVCIMVFFQPNAIVSAISGLAPTSCEERLDTLEPKDPKVIYDYELLIDRDLSKFKEKIFPISLVQKEGSNLPFEVVYKDLKWKRPAYSPIWHSSNLRWSNVPLNMANQQHRVFGYSMGLSGWYDFSNDLALPNPERQPSPINKYAFTIKYPYVVRLVVFDFNIESMKYYKNQIVVFGQPLRNGITILDFDIKNLPGSKLLQLSTPDGYELDYLVIG